MGYENLKNSNQYLLAPERLHRRQIAAEISRAFSIYYRQLNNGRAITFRNLRKTYMSVAMNDYGAASTALTGHKNISTTLTHYFDKKVTRENAKRNFSIYKKDEEND